MKTALISFLGKNVADPKTGYRTATCRFAYGHESSTRFFAFTLAQKLNPDLMVILSTTSSMWDVLIEHLADGTEAELFKPGMRSLPRGARDTV